MYKIIIALIVSYYSIIFSAFSSDIEISAIVEGKIITNYDIDQRIKIISLTSGMVFNQNTIGTVRKQVRELLITETLQYLESSKYSLSIKDDEVDRVFDSIATDNKMSRKSFEDFLYKRNIDIEAFKGQIRNSLNWQNVILYKIRPLISISDYEIANYFESIEDGADGYEYLVDIVSFPISHNKGVKKLVSKIYDKVSKDELEFSSVIRDFGKDLGRKEKKIWKYKKDFQQEVQDAIVNLAIGDVASPIKIEDSYYLVYLVNKRPSLVNVEDKNYKNEIYKKLFVQKLEKKVKSYLKTLKQNSFIEYKS